MNWLEVPQGKYDLRSESGKISNCQIELDCSVSHLISHEPDGEWSKIAPLRILSFDIECAGRKGIFPDPDIDPVIQIASMVTRQGESHDLIFQRCSHFSATAGENKPFVRNVFTLNTCSNIVGSQVMSFQDESKMLDKWQEYLEEIDPDIVIGYNTSNFDIPYLMDRAKKIKATKFPFLGRLKSAYFPNRSACFSLGAVN